MSDQLFKKRQQERKKRISKQIAERAETWLIVCEGEKTETQYFKSLVSWANSKSTNELKIQTYGHGENTLTLVKKVDDLISFVDGKSLILIFRLVRFLSFLIKILFPIQILTMLYINAYQMIIYQFGQTNVLSCGIYYIFKCWIVI